MEKTSEEIKKEELVRTKDFTKRQMNIYVRTIKLIRFFFLEKVLWFISIIPFIIIPSLAVYFGIFDFDIATIITILLTHLLYWKFYGKKETDILINESTPELDQLILILEEIRNERFN
jgi:hypothetical protein